MPDSQQYTDAQLSDGTTLRFLGQLGPDEVRQKVQGYRANNPQLAVPKPPLPGALNPKFNPMEPSREETGGTSPRQGLLDAMRGPLMGAATVAPMMTGGASLPLKMLVSGVSGAAQDELLGGDTDEALTSGAIGAALPALGPLANSRFGRGAIAGIKAGAGRVPFVGPPIRAGLRAAMQEWNPGPEVERAITRQMVPEYAGELEEGESQALTRRSPRLIQQMGGKPVETITAKPSGRVVLTPEEAQQEQQQLSLAKKIASQRGMQYAAGMRPTNPGTQ